MSLLLMLALPIVALAAIMGFAVWEANRFAERVIGRKHRWIEEIMQTGAVPADWAGGDGPLARLGMSLTGRPRVAGLARHVRRLDELIVYVENSPLMGDEETRDVVLDRLDEVRDAWAQGFVTS
jgi:hypothetical protein